MKRLLVLIFITGGAVAAAAAGAGAAWYVSATAPTASVKGGMVATGAPPVVAVTGSNVTVSWTAAAPPVSGYLVKAYDAATSGSRAVGAECAGTIASTSCTESVVPNGSWKYTVTPVLEAWTGTESPRSEAATVDVAPPTVAITFPAASFYRSSDWNAGCASTICGTATSTGSTVTNVKVSVRQDAGGRYWNGSNFAGTGETFTSAIGTTSWSLAFPAGAAMADGTYTVHAVATDANTRTSETSVVAMIDNRAPTGDLATLATPLNDSPTLSMSSGTVTDNGGSGVASVRYVYCPGTSCTPNVTVGTVTVAGAPTYGFVWDTSTLADGTYRVSATMTDAAGNTSALEPVQTLALDRSGPTITNVAIPNGNQSKRLDSGDQVVVTFSELLDTRSLCSSWHGTGSQSLQSNNDVSVTVTHGTGAGHDVLTVSSGTCSFHFGSLDLGSNAWVSSTRTFKGSGSGRSRIDWSSSSMTLTITLGSGTSGTSNVGVKAMVYTPATDIADPLGNPIAVTSYSFTDGF
jgi:hypothetical protein